MKHAGWKLFFSIQKALLPSEQGLLADIGVSLGFDDLAALNATGADTNALVGTGLQLGLYRAQIHIPAALGDVVCVRDVVTELRTLAANLTNLCHDLRSSTFC